MILVILCILLLCLLQNSSTKLIKIRPLKCRGTITRTTAGRNPTSIPTIYLGRDKIEILEPDESTAGVNEVTVCDLIPVPMPRNDLYENIVHLITKKKSLTTSSYSIIDKNSCITAASIVTGRDKGLFDNLPFMWGQSQGSRRALYSFLQGGDSTTIDGEKLSLKTIDYQSFQSSEEIIQFSLKKVLGCSIVGLVVEVKDEMTRNNVALGAAAVLARTGYEDEFRISSSNPGLPEFEDIASAPGCLVNIHMDELVLLSLAMDMPVYIPKPLFLGAAVDASLENSDGELTMKLTVYNHTAITMLLLLRVAT